MPAPHEPNNRQLVGIFGIIAWIIVWAAIVFAEAPSATQWTGVAIVLLGVAAAAGRATITRSGAATRRST